MISVVIPTFGDFDAWNPLAQRAVKSVMNQTVEAQIVRVHGDSLADARNKGGYKAKGDWLIFLDASDELDSHYVEAMAEGVGDIRRPATLGIVDGVEDDYPVLIPRTNILERNCIVIGAMIRKKDFIQIDGFSPDLEALEDWHCWLRLINQGALVGDVPDAIYRVHFDSEKPGRNSNIKNHGRAYAKIRSTCNSLQNVSSSPYV